MNLPQVKNIGTLDELRRRVEELGIELPLPEGDAHPATTLGEPLRITTGGAELVSPNRFAILPMEGWDGDTAGAPTDLVRRRWARFGDSGAGLVWAEATAVRPDGRANPNQLVLSEQTAEQFSALRDLLAPDQAVGLQLTHSGRWARPEGGPLPRIAYRHPELDGQVGASDAAVLSDDELDAIADAYVRAAGLAAAAGFDFVDVKACHGYLLHELLSGVDRPGRFGGDLDGRSRFMLDVISRIRTEYPGLGVAVRLSIFDVRPHRPDADGVGVPAGTGPYPYAFGGDGDGLGIDLTETHELLRRLEDVGVGLVSTTAGSPYYCPHVQRPAYFPPSDGYQPPEDPLVGVARQIAATAEIAAAHPGLALVGSGYTYLQDWLPVVGAGAVDRGMTSMVGLGRMALSYPDLPADVLTGRPLQRRAVCRTFSDCTTAPRAGLVSGCYPLDPFYKDREERVRLAAVKREIRARARRS